MALLAVWSSLLALAPHAAVAERISTRAMELGEPSFHASARELLSPRRRQEEEADGPGAEQGEPLAEGGGEAASQVQVGAGKFGFGKFGKFGGKFGKFGGKFGKFGGKFGKFSKFGKFGGKFGKHKMGKFGKNKHGVHGKWGKAGKNKHGVFGGSMWGNDKGGKKKHGKNTHYQGGGYMPPSGGHLPHAGGNNPYFPGGGNYPGGYNGAVPGHGGYNGYPAQGGYDGAYRGQAGNIGGYQGGRGGHNGGYPGQGAQHGGYPGQGGYGGYGVGNPMPLFLGARGSAACPSGEPLADENACRTEAARQFGTAVRSTTSSGHTPGGCSFDRRTSTLAFNTNLRSAAGDPAMIPVCLLRPPPGGGRSPVGRVFLGGPNTKDCAGGFPVTSEGECRADAAMKLGVSPARIQSVALAGVPGGCVFNGDKAVVIFNTKVSSTATNARIMPVCKVAA